MSTTATAIDHGGNLIGKLGLGGATVWATVSAISADTVSAWLAVVIGGAFYGFAEWRKALKGREQDKLDIAARKAVNAANMKAIHAGTPVPYPEFLPAADRAK